MIYFLNEVSYETDIHIEELIDNMYKTIDNDYIIVLESTRYHYEANEFVFYCTPIDNDRVYECYTEILNLDDDVLEGLTKINIIEERNLIFIEEL